MAIDLKLLYAGGITLVILAVFLAIGSQIVGDVRDDQTVTATWSVANESVTINTFDVTGNLSLHTSTYTPLTLTILNVWNGTAATDVHLTSTSYAANGTTQFDMTNQSYENSTVFRVEYTWTSSDFSVAGNVSTSGIDALLTFSDWFAIIVIVLVAAVVVVILITGLGSKASA